MYSMGRDPRRIKANPDPVGMHRCMQWLRTAVSTLENVGGSNVNAGEPQNMWKGQETPTTH